MLIGVKVSSLGQGNMSCQIEGITEKKRDRRVDSEGNKSEKYNPIPRAVDLGKPKQCHG